MRFQHRPSGFWPRCFPSCTSSWWTVGPSPANWRHIEAKLEARASRERERVVRRRPKKWRKLRAKKGERHVRIPLESSALLRFGCACDRPPILQDMHAPRALHEHIGQSVCNQRGCQTQYVTMYADSLQTCAALKSPARCTFHLRRADKQSLLSKNRD